MYYYTDDDDRTMAAESAMRHIAEKEREKVQKEKAALVREIFADIEILLRRKTEKVDFTDGTCNVYFKQTLAEDLIELRKKYTEKYKRDQSNE